MKTTMTKRQQIGGYVYQSGRRDKNEREIIDALRGAGASVQQLHAMGVPDLLVGYRGVNILLEVKSDKGKLNGQQVDWHAKWQGAVSVVRSPEEALRELGIVHD